MEIKEVYASDFERVYELLQLFENTQLTKEGFRKLFLSYWQCSVNYKGLIVEEEGRVVAYLGLIFSTRTIAGKPQIFCNLTTLMVHPAQRGKKLTHKIVAHLLQKGDYTFTAITPIPSLYNMYRQNGFVNLPDERLMLWGRFSNKQRAAGYSEDAAFIAAHLTGGDLRIFNDHSRFNCIHALYTINGQVVYMVFKKRLNQLRKFLDKRFFNYADALLRKLGSKGFLYQPTLAYELMYVNQPALLAANIKPIAASFFSLHKQVAGIALPVWLHQKHRLNYPFINSFVHSRQMYFSKSVRPEEVDTLYSEIFVLDM